MLNTFRFAACLIAAVAALALAGAWFFQLVVGLSPCPLCLDQRVPYYVAVPLAIAIALVADRKSIARAGFFLLALVLAVGCALAVYHAGVEWKFWPGPQDCSGAVVELKGGSLLDQMNQTRVVRCDEAAWRLFGISLAGYNAIIAAALALFALRMGMRK
ncbi:MAG TPA: disulfide bond formation protein B [Xanthobacteraceae bacterium]|nr:disulfide bond formation protein B [Xanthobacteraceae bacterium]